MTQKEILGETNSHPVAAFLLGSTFIASFYIGILTWAQGWDYASAQFARHRWYAIPIILGFGIPAALFPVFVERPIYFDLVHLAGRTAA